MCGIKMAHCVKAYCPNIIYCLQAGLINTSANTYRFAESELHNTFDGFKLSV